VVVAKSMIGPGRPSVGDRHRLPPGALVAVSPAPTSRCGERVAGLSSKNGVVVTRMDWRTTA